jgi:hypothetical protein
MNPKILVRILFLVLLCFIVADAEAQCAMCKQVADTGAKNGSTVAKGLNMGILYLLGVPFLAIATFCIAVWRRWKAAQK